MKLLLYANLSWRLTKRLSSYFPTVEHVTNTGLPKPAVDQEIWKWALANDYIIVTNDEDFLNLLTLKGYPPKVVLLRRGNQSTEQIAVLLIASHANIEALDKAENYGLLEIY